MAITSWTSEGMNWSGSLSGHLLMPYMLAIAKATIERIEFATTARSFPYVDILAGLKEFRDNYSERHIAYKSDPDIPQINFIGADIVGVGELVDEALDEMIVDDADAAWDFSNAHAGGGNVYRACNYTHNSGSWHLYSGTETQACRRWDWDDILADIGDPARIRVIDTGTLSAAWLKQVYELLNRCKWFVARKGDRATGANGWYTMNYPTESISSRSVQDSVYRPTSGDAISITEALYDATSDTVGGGSDINPQKWNNIIVNEDSTLFLGEITCRENRVVFYRNTDLAFDYEVYADINGYDEFDAHGTGLVENSYNRINTGNFALADALGWHDLPVISDTVKPTTWFAGTLLEDFVDNKRGFQAEAPLLLRKYDVTDGFAFQA